MTITEFLLARIADGERWLKPPTRYLLAICQAHRAIVAEHSPIDPCDAHGASFETIPCDTLRHLAAIYRDHPDYQPEWAA